MVDCCGVQELGDRGAVSGEKGVGVRIKVRVRVRSGREVERKRKKREENTIIREMFFLSFDSKTN